MSTARRVLIVEDDFLVGEKLRGLLAKEGHLVVGETASGKQAIEMTAALQPDVVMMDIHLLEMDGLAAARQIMARCPAPIVALTAHDSQDLVAEASQAGIGYYLVKPASRREIARAIEIAIARFDDLARLQQLNAALQQEIAERERFEAALQASEEQFRALFETMTEGVALHEMIYDQAGNPVDYVILKLNPAYQRQTGIAPEAAVGRRASEVYGIDRPPFLDIYARVAAGGQPAEFETYSASLDRHLAVSAFSPGQGQFATVFEDIGARKRAEQITGVRLHLAEAAATTSSRALMQMTLDEIEALTGSEIGFYHLLLPDQETLALQAWSTNTLARMCAAEGQSLHYPISEAGVWIDCVRERAPVIHNDYAALPHRQGLPEGHAPVVRELVLPIMRGERIVAVLGVGNKATNYDQKDVDVTALLADLSWEIVERKRAEEALRQSETLLNQSQAIGHIGSWELDLVANRLAWSDEVYRIFGLRPQEFRATYEAFIEQVHPDDRAAVDAAYSKSLAQGGRPYEIEHRIVRQDNGAVRIVHEKCEHVRDDSGQIVRSIGIVQDITERKEADEALQESARELARSNRNLEQFAYAVSHDLQEPLRMVSSFLGLLVQRCGEQIDEQGHEFIDYALDGASRMQAMIGGLLDLSRVTTRGRDLVPVDANAVLENTLHVLQLAIKDSGATVSHDRLPVVLADKVQLGQVFQNLIGNALKFRGQDPPRIHVSAKRRGTRWCFSVRDNGPGLDPAQAGRIFGVFQRLHTRDEYPGLGLGLAICKKIVERHGGRIWVESEPGQGAIFFFTIPGKE